MIRNLRDTTTQEPRAGLAQDQPRALHRHAAGPERHQDGREAHHERARAAGERASRRVLPQRADRRHAAAALHGGLRRAAPPRHAAVLARRRPGGPVRGRERAHPGHQRARRTTCRSTSGSGHAQPLNVVVLPVLFEGDIKAVIELASFETFSDNHLLFLDQLTQSIGIVLNTIAANMRTEELLKQSQSLTIELQSQQDELQQTNEELEEKARLLAEQNEEVEKRTREIEEARRALEQKAEQLALTSKYKSQFLANMSHELRTPLNSLLILSKQLSDNREQNLSGKQVEMAQTIRRAGSDLLTLINDILDLSKIESGTTSVDIAEQRIARHLRRRRAHVPRRRAGARSRSSRSTSTAKCPSRSRPTRRASCRSSRTCSRTRSSSPPTARSSSHCIASRASVEAQVGQFVAFSVHDTGIGIPADKHNVIFEAFQQADMSTARKYGGTGLGLAISREIAGLLGGDMTVEVRAGRGHRRSPSSIRSSALARTTTTIDGLPPAPAPRTKTIADDVAVDLAVQPRPVVSALVRVDGPVDDDRDGRAAAGPRRAHHRGRRDVRAHSARPRARPRLQGAHGEHAAPTASRSRASSFPTRSRSTSACPTSTAGRCSTSSSEIPPRAASPSTSSPAKSSGRRRWTRARSRTSRSRPAKTRSRKPSTTCSASRTPRRATCSSSRTT